MRMTFTFVDAEGAEFDFVASCYEPAKIAKAFNRAARKGWRLKSTETFFANRTEREGWH